MELIPVLVTSALSAALVAWWKGNSIPLWFLIGFCLPIMGTILAYLYRSERKELRRRCEGCDRELLVTDQICFGCGRELYWPEGKTAPESPKTTANIEDSGVRAG